MPIRGQKTRFDHAYTCRIFAKENSKPAMTPLRAVSTIRFDAKCFGFLFQLCCQDTNWAADEPMMESPEVLREPAVAVPQSRRTVEEVSDADTPRSAHLPQAVAATTPHHNIATPRYPLAEGSGAGAMEDDSDDAAPRGGRAARRRAPPPRSSSDDDSSRSKTSKEAAAPLTAPLAAPLTARVPDAADGYAATTPRVRTPAAQRAYEEKHADSDDDQPPTKPDKDSSDDDDGPVYDDMEDLHQGCLLYTSDAADE